MMRILHITAGNLYGGVQTVLATVARHAQAVPDLEQHFALCFPGRCQRELAAAGVPLHDLGAVKASRPWTIVRGRHRLSEILRSSTYDAVVCHGAWVVAMFGSTIRFCGAGLIYWMHDLPDGWHWTERWARRNRPHLAICNSRFTRGFVQRLFPGARSVVSLYPIESLPPDICPAERRTLRESLGIPPEAVVIIQVSRMETWKGHLLHLEALSKLKDVVTWQCVIAGGIQRPSERQHFEKLSQFVRTHGLEGRVHFLGQRSDVPRLLSLADVFCQPNQGPEPFGIVFVEALFAGLPAVTTDMGGAREIVDESCGFLVPPNDSGALAAVLRRLIEDEPLRQRLGETGRHRARQLCDPRDRIVDLSQHIASAAASFVK